MATLEKLRNRAGTLVAVVIGLALLAFILGDLLGSGGSFNRNQFEIAEISGKSIPYQVYQQRVDHVVELNKASRRVSALDEQTTENIREEVWNQLLQEYVLSPRYKELGITISPDELFDMVQGNNLHPIIRQEFGNPQTGEVDVAMVDQFLRNLDSDPSGFQRSIWLYLEDIIIKDRLFTKYSNLVRKGLYVTDIHAQQSASERSSLADISFIVERYSSINDSLVSVSSKEIKSYYKENIEKYKQSASRDVEYVVFPINPSPNDYELAEEWINEIQKDFEEASDAGQFANLNSDVPYEGKFFKKGEISNKEINTWAFNAKVGDSFGPIFDGDSYIIARLVDVDFLPDSVKARHILLSSNVQSQEEYDAVKAKADSILKIVKRNRNSFAQLATDFSEDPGSAVQGGDLGWFPEGAMVQPFNDACFNGEKGDIVLVESQFGFHIIEIQEKGNLAKKVQVAQLVRNVIPSSKTYQNIYQQASAFAGLNNTYEKFNAAVIEKKLNKRLASNLRESDKRIAGLENPREMVRWAYKEDVNAVSPVFEFGDNFVVAALKEVRKEGFAPLAQVQQEVKNQVIKQKKAQMLKDKFSEAMEEGATVNDVANKLSLQVHDAPGISFSSFSLPTVGFEPAVIAAASTVPEGELALPIEGNAGVFALTVNAINVQEVDKAAEEQRILNIYQQRATRESYEALKEEAEIVDRRSKFF
ncbi:MAG: SurA N-terminal domain-containing protein [Bacteroidales bacterium]|nr:SurA N-terminal domain-containing protein [Bacteroidales bacterium]MDY0347337.1 SurA N-terminal domain-containing protein [Tenuifilaceae bacterium]